VSKKRKRVSNIRSPGITVIAMLLGHCGSSSFTSGEVYRYTKSTEEFPGSLVSMKLIESASRWTRDYLKPRIKRARARELRTEE
jgi:hypothetical protein